MTKELENFKELKKICREVIRKSKDIKPYNNLSEYLKYSKEFSNNLNTINRRYY